MVSPEDQDVWVTGVNSAYRDFAPQTPSSDSLLATTQLADTSVSGYAASSYPCASNSAAASAGSLADTFVYRQPIALNQLVQPHLDTSYHHSFVEPFDDSERRSFPQMQAVDTREADANRRELERQLIGLLFSAPGRLADVLGASLESQSKTDEIFFGTRMAAGLARSDVWSKGGVNAVTVDEPTPPSEQITTGNTYEGEFETEQTLLDGNFDSATVFDSFQAAPHPEFGYRPEMGVYQVLEDTQVPTGHALANPNIGSGGAQQFFFGNYGQQLQLINRIPLGH